MFERSFDCKPITTQHFFIEELNYIHNNSCSGVWKLVENPVDYKHSSAKYYMLGIQSDYPIIDQMNVRVLHPHKRLGVETRPGRNYAFDNPMRFIDPDGMGPNDVIITGDKAKEAFKQLQQSTSLKLSWDDKGKVTATGTAKTDADKKLEEATKDKKVIVTINATLSNYSKSRHWFVGGAFGGSTVKNGKIITTQTVNPDITKKIDNFYSMASGVSVLHEVIESYIGGKEHPGVSEPTIGDVEQKTKNGVAYLDSHNQANAIDPRHKQVFVTQDPSTHNVYLDKYDPNFDFGSTNPQEFLFKY